MRFVSAVSQRAHLIVAVGLAAMVTRPLEAAIASTPRGAGPATGIPKPTRVIAKLSGPRSNGAANPADKSQPKSAGASTVFTPCIEAREEVCKSPAARVENTHDLLERWNLGWVDKAPISAVTQKINKLKAAEHRIRSAMAGSMADMMRLDSAILSLKENVKGDRFRSSLRENKKGNSRSSPFIAQLAHLLRQANAVDGIVDHPATILSNIAALRGAIEQRLEKRMKAAKSNGAVSAQANGHDTISKWLEEQNAALLEGMEIAERRLKFAHDPAKRTLLADVIDAYETAISGSGRVTGETRAETQTGDSAGYSVRGLKRLIRLSRKLEDQAQHGTNGVKGRNKDNVREKARGELKGMGTTLHILLGERNEKRSATNTRRQQRRSQPAFAFLATEISRPKTSRKGNGTFAERPRDATRSQEADRDSDFVKLGLNPDAATLAHLYERPDWIAAPQP
jgi:hypothetical protein